MKLAKFNKIQNPRLQIFEESSDTGTGGQKWEQLRGWQRAHRQDRQAQQADRRSLRGEDQLRNISVNL